MTAASLSWRDDVVASLTGVGGLELEIDAPLSKRTTFGIGGPADLLVTANTDADVVAVLTVVEQHGLPLFVLGGGSNLLVGDGGIRGVVLTLRGDLAEQRIEDGGATVVVGAGCTFPRLTRTALDLGWPGALGWMGTPGQVGGALLMNAGSIHGEIGADVVEVHAVSVDGPQVFTREQCGFAYRSSVFQRRGVGGARRDGASEGDQSITSASGSRDDSSLTSTDQQTKHLVLTRAILRCEKFATEKARELDAQAKELLARRHRTQPKLRSAGSLFKNPVGDFAGRLIEASGLKGFTMGRAQVSPVHANFVVNLGGARAADVVAVADHVVATVKRDHGVELVWEVRRVGEFVAFDASIGGAP